MWQLPLSVRFMRTTIACSVVVFVALPIHLGVFMMENGNALTGFLLRAGTQIIYPSMAVHVTGYRRGRPIFIIPCVRRPCDRLAFELNIAASQVSSGLLQTAQTWANAGVCGGLCACAVGGTFD